VTPWGWEWAVNIGIQEHIDSKIYPRLISIVPWEDIQKCLLKCDGCTQFCEILFSIKWWSFTEQRWMISTISSLSLSSCATKWKYRKKWLLPYMIVCTIIFTHFQNGNLNIGWSQFQYSAFVCQHMLYTLCCVKKVKYKTLSNRWFFLKLLILCVFLLCEY